MRLWLTLAHAAKADACLRVLEADEAAKKEF
jgi:hypothetical protein